MLLNWPPSVEVLLYLPALLAGFTVHELAHALVALGLGDTSQVERNRLTFNPLRHVSWFGMGAFLLFGFGWAKPVHADTTRFRIKNRHLGVFLVAIAGAGANLLLAAAAFMGMVGSGVIVSAMTGASVFDVFAYLVPQEIALDAHGLVVALSWYMVYVNLVLALFNLLPLPMFDGFQAMVGLVYALRYALQPAKGDPTGPATPSWASLRKSAATPSLAGQEPAPSPAQIHFDIALEYQQAGQVDEAIARYRQAIAHDEQFGLAYYNLGLAYLAKGRLSLAAGAFRSALHFGRDVRVRIAADQRLREVAHAEQNGSHPWDPVPPPLEPDPTAELVGPGAASALDPTLLRRVWLHLAAGGLVALVLALSTWVLTTLLTLLAFI
jgi:Zn-dependent protease